MLGCGWGVLKVECATCKRNHRVAPLCNAKSRLPTPISGSTSRYVYWFWNFRFTLPTAEGQKGKKATVLEGGKKLSDYDLKNDSVVSDRALKIMS